MRTESNSQLPLHYIGAAGKCHRFPIPPSGGYLAIKARPEILGFAQTEIVGYNPDYNN